MDFISIDFDTIEKGASALLGQYGYHAVPFLLLADPAGVPWGWIFLLLLAGEAGKNIPILLFYGLFVLIAFDHALYWLGLLGGRKLVRWVGRKKPSWKAPLRAARRNVRDRGTLAVIFGRYLPFIGRYVGLGAGLSGMNYVRFAVYDLAGAGLTVFGFGVGSHLIGKQAIKNPIYFQIAVIVAFLGLLSGIVSVLWHWVQRRRRKTAVARQKKLAHL